MGNKKGFDKINIERENKKLSSNINNESPLLIKDVIFYKTEDLIKESYLNMEYVGETIENIIKNLLSKFKFSIKYRNFYAYLMREIARNDVEHSNSNELAIILYSNNIKEFGFKVIDYGIGIMESLNSNPNYLVGDDKTALAFAIRPGITKAWKKDPNRDDIWQNSGFGLFMVSTIVNEIGGRFEVASGKYKIIYKNGFREYNRCNINGTEVTVVFDTSMEINTLEIIKNASIKGREYLKNNEKFSYYGKIKTASKASTLLKDE